MHTHAHIYTYTYVYICMSIYTHIHNQLHLKETHLRFNFYKNYKIINDSI